MSLRTLTRGLSSASCTCLLLLAVGACEADKAEGGSSAGAPSSAGTPGVAGTATAAGGSTSVAGSSGSAGMAAGGTSSAAGSNSAGTGGQIPGAGCDTPGLTWKTARKTWYTSHPDPGSEECIEYNGCTWAGLFAACNDKKTEEWVSQHNIVAAFPGYAELELHDLCLKSGDKTIVVTVLDTCADSDCSGCCTENQGENDALIDLESYTNQKFGVEDGQIQWADLGPTKTGGCN